MKATFTVERSEINEFVDTLDSMKILPGFGGYFRDRCSEELKAVKDNHAAIIPLEDITAITLQQYIGEKFSSEKCSIYLEITKNDSSERYVKSMTVSFLEDVYLQILITLSKQVKMLWNTVEGFQSVAKSVIGAQYRLQQDTKDFEYRNKDILDSLSEEFENGGVRYTLTGEITNISEVDWVSLIDHMFDENGDPTLNIRYNDGDYIDELLITISEDDTDKFNIRHVKRDDYGEIVAGDTQYYLSVERISALIEGFLLGKEVGLVSARVYNSNQGETHYISYKDALSELTTKVTGSLIDDFMRQYRSMHSKDKSESDK